MMTNRAKELLLQITDEQNHEGFNPGREHISLLKIKKPKSFFKKNKKKSKKPDDALMSLYMAL